MKKEANTAQESPKKLTLSVRKLEELESRASPHTICPDSGAAHCCSTSIMQSAKLTSVAYF